MQELDPLVHGLWDLPEREYQYAALGLLSKLEKKLPAGFILTLEDLLVTKSWWDTVDTLAAGVVGAHFQRYPQVCAEKLAEWQKSENFWLRRTCILFQLGYKKNTDFPLLCDIIRENLASKEFFINKAIG